MRFVRFILLREVIFATVVAGSTISYGQDSSESEEGTGMMNACWSQALAIDSYEVCVDSWQSGIKPDDVDFEIRTIHVIGRDFSNRRYYSLKYEEKREKDTRKMCVSAVTFIDEVCSWLTCDGRRQVDRHGRLWNVLPRSDVRLIGHTHFPWTELRTELGMSIDDRYSPARRFSYRHRGTEANISHEETLGEQRFASHWKVDLRTSLPLEYRRLWYIEDAASWKELTREEVTWDSSRITPVPVRVLGLAREGGLAKSGEYETFETDYEATVHWDSLNQPIAGDVFNVELNATIVMQRIDAAKRKFNIK